MSNYHIRKTAYNLKTVNVVFHIPIPATNNAVGIAWRDVIVLDQGGASNITSVLPDITVGELDAMKLGSVYEYAKSVEFTSLDLTNAQRLSEVESAYTNAKTSMLARINKTMNFYNKSGDVA